MRKFLLALAVVAVLVVGIGARPAAAESYENRASMFCGEGTGRIGFGLPIVSDGRYSVFYYRVDGGQWVRWQTYYTWNTQRWLWTQDGWQSLPLGSSSGSVALGRGHFVEGWEARYYPNGTRYGVRLASCWTTEYSSGGYITYPH